MRITFHKFAILFLSVFVLSQVEAWAADPAQYRRGRYEGHASAPSFSYTMPAPAARPAAPPPPPPPPSPRAAPRADEPARQPARTIASSATHSNGYGSWSGSYASSSNSGASLGGQSSNSSSGGFDLRGTASSIAATGGRAVVSAANGAGQVLDKAGQVAEWAQRNPEQVDILMELAVLIYNSEVVGDVVQGTGFVLNKVVKEPLIEGLVFILGNGYRGYLGLASAGEKVRTSAQQALNSTWNASKWVATSTLSAPQRVIGYLRDRRETSQGSAESTSGQQQLDQQIPEEQAVAAFDIGAKALEVVQKEATDRNIPLDNESIKEIISGSFAKVKQYNISPDSFWEELIKIIRAAVEEIYKQYQKNMKTKTEAVEHWIQYADKRKTLAKKYFPTWRTNAAAKAQKAFLTHMMDWLGGAPEASLPVSIRGAELVKWTGSSYNVFNQTESTYDKTAAEYRWVRSKLNADQYGVLYDLAVSYRAHTNLSDSHADNNWIIEASRMGSDNLPGAVKLVHHCTEVLKGKDITNDGVLKAISDMAADTLVTGGRIGIDLHRQATEDEMRVMIPALRQRGAIALQLAKDNNITEALEAVAKTFLDAAFRHENPASPNRKAIYNKDRFDSHKAHCFMAAARGAKKGDWDEVFEQQVLGKLTGRGMAGMTQAYIKSTKEYYDGFDN